MIEEIDKRIKKRKVDDENASESINIFTLLAAVKAGDLFAVKQAVDFGIDVNSRDRYGDTALMKASNDTAEMLKCLIELGANINATDCREATALMYASEAGNIDNVKVLLEHGARIVCDMHGYTAIVYALKNPFLETLYNDYSSHLQCITYLLDHDLTSKTVDQIDNKGQTYLIHAAYSTTVYPSNNHDNDETLRIAYQIECVNLLIDKRPDLKDDMNNNIRHKIIRKSMNND